MNGGLDDEIDPGTLASLERMAAEEGTTPERVLNLAVGLYLALPRTVRDALDRTHARGDVEEMLRMQWEVERVALRALERIAQARTGSVPPPG